MADIVDCCPENIVGCCPPKLTQLADIDGWLNPKNIDVIDGWLNPENIDVIDEIESLVKLLVQSITLIILKYIGYFKM